MQRQGQGPGRFFGKKRTPGKGKPPPKRPESIHKRNLRLVAHPALLFFALIRFIAFNLWLLLSVLVGASRNLLASKDQRQSDQHDLEKSKGSAMAQKGPSAEHLLSRQKQHHRKAFEYISKALKIDEEDKGMTNF